MNDMKNVSRFACPAAIVLTISSYLAFNLVVHATTLGQLGCCNVLAGLATLVIFRKEVFTRGSFVPAMRKPQWKYLVLGSLGMVLSASGLHWAQIFLGRVTVTMQYTYDCFVVSGAAVALWLAWRGGRRITQPANMILHAVMLCIVVLHVLLSWSWSFSVFLIGSGFVAQTVIGLTLFTSSLKHVASESKAVTRGMTNIVGGIILIASGFAGSGSGLAGNSALLIAGGGLILVSMTWGLSKSFEVFKKAGHDDNLVLVLVYDGNLIVPSFLQLFVLAFGLHMLVFLVSNLVMVAVMVLRSPQLQVRLHLA